MFYDKYCQLCEENGVSPTKAAEDMGIGRATVSRWKNNGSLPITRHIHIMTEYFSVSPNYLLSISENEYKNSNAFFERFSQLCQEVNKSTTGVCAELGVSKSTVSYWRHGHTPKHDAISKIAHYFSVSVDYLLGNSNIKNDTLQPGTDELMHLITILQNRPDIKSFVYAADKEDPEKINKLSEILKIL